MPTPIHNPQSIPAIPPAIQPADLGLPAKFKQWRPGQYEAIMQAISAPQRFIALNLPTGSGKSLTARAVAILLGGKSLTLTSSKGLQDQYSTDFPDLVDIRGRQNYDCLLRGTCADGRLSGCSHTAKTPESPGDCTYTIARESYLGSSAAISNYACYLANVMHGEGMGKIDLLILDEAHSVLEELSSVLTITLNHNEYESVCKKTGAAEFPVGQSMGAWRNWAKNTLPAVKSLFDAVKRDGGHTSWLRIIDTMKGTLTRIEQVDDSWILDETKAGETSFAPLWPTDYAEKLLYRGIPKILFLSATIVPKTLDLNGVPPGQSLFLSHAHNFDLNRSPVYLFGEHKIDFRTTPEQFVETIGRMDTLIDRRMDRKGIIHPVSYDRASDIMQRSIHAGLMIAPKGKMLHDSLALFRASSPPRILISPAITTGYDFPYRDCEYQFIFKLPFIDGRSPIMKARSTADPEYIPYLTAQILTQTCGRGMRSPDDQCENFILDKHAQWFLKPKARPGSRSRGGFRHLFPDWFLSQLRYPDSFPVPPPPL